MELTDLQKLMIKNNALRILHVPGNFKGGILEAALVLDYALPKELLLSYSKEILSYLKNQGEPFLNIRLNLIKWKDNEHFIKEVSSVPAVIMGRFLEDYEECTVEKHYDTLTGQLKKFYARSKLILILTSKDRKAADSSVVQSNLQPFLGRKTMLIYPDGSSHYPSTQELLKL